jgi:peptidoglycan/xylan/chitin deacetylase (PgdA/CDA1 family)
VPLLVDDAGAVYAATRTYPDGREALALTFSQSPTSLPSLQLAYGVVSWVTRGLFVGERHVYVAPQIDDFFLASAIYPMAGTYRITADDLQAFTNWQAARQAEPLTAQFRAAFAFNAFGAKPPGRDGLTDKALALGPTFAWINHTWDHAEMDAMSYADAFSELSQNNQYGVGSGLGRFSPENLVTPSMTGLRNAEVMRAAYDVGIRQVISDGSAPCQDNPSPNAGLLQRAGAHAAADPAARDRALLQRLATVRMGRGVRDAALGERDHGRGIVDHESTEQLRFLLRGESDPWMFHQANLRDLGGGRSLLTMYLDAVLAKYAARATFPIVSPTMDELAQKMKARMAFDAAGVTASIEPGGKLTVQVAHAATIPVTGLCTPTAEAYAGQQISYLQLADGQSVTLSLTDCNPDFNDDDDDAHARRSGWRHRSRRRRRRRELAARSDGGRQLPAGRARAAPAATRARAAIRRWGPLTTDAGTGAYGGGNGWRLRRLRPPAVATGRAADRAGDRGGRARGRGRGGRGGQASCAMRPACPADPCDRTGAARPAARPSGRARRSAARAPPCNGSLHCSRCGTARARRRPGRRRMLTSPNSRRRRFAAAPSPGKQVANLSTSACSSSSSCETGRERAAASAM